MSQTTTSTLKKKIVRRPVPAPNSPQEDSLPPLIRRIYSARGIVSSSDCDYSLNRLIPPERLKGMDEAAAILAEAVCQQQRILFVGDFDADGATSTSVGILALQMLGARSVDYIVPNRFEYGYGLTPEIVEVAASRNPDVLVTVDNGISSLEGVAAAKKLGWKVVVTDHHLAGDELPEADAIVNPNQPGCSFPSKAVAGVGVIFYVMLAVRRLLRENHWFSRSGLSEPNLAELLDLVALGTVADVVSLDGNNRILVDQGIKRIRAGRCRPGVLALLEVANRQPANLVASDLGFAVAPRLNAAGRLEDMSLGIECLLTDSMVEARAMAQELDGLNHARKAIEKDMQEQALTILSGLGELGTDMPPGVCLYEESWHQGVIGILASRIKDRLHRPVIAFAATETDEIKGSARSIPGLHIRDCLDAIAKKHPDLLNKFGGHAMAAGLSLKSEKFPLFAEAFAAEVGNTLTEDDLQATILTDGELAPDELSLESAQQLRTAGPWGQAFPEPIFDGEFEVASWRIVGGHHLKLTLSEPRTGRLVDGIQFNVDPGVDYDQWSRVHLVYKLDVNHFRGESNLQLLVDYSEPV
ncbi:single-stranded-DNA-specific exonuclease RecJ [Hahella sp. CCB-MM4]|uniref:single-stranded-DNA-specific exonuclease RecJ n=1 Tax=Hahella sp. (strain CCB-MM4) TaxID=1926491 RepID=UPI000B9BFA9E|nr:single-stranded-DNA-specific exonuclease RecJ [Hahella sp. CCB-MM4]OZG70637.1 single-stranded-DNA-specific exonuclease RecJ [Hahella sp. CCB-MM4]